MQETPGLARLQIREVCGNAAELPCDPLEGPRLPEHRAQVGSHRGAGGRGGRELTGGETELDGEAERVDQLAVLRSEEVGTDDLVVRLVDEDLRGGRLADPVVGVPVAGVGVADDEVDPGLAGF